MKDLKLFYLLILIKICIYNPIIEAVPSQILNISDDAKGIVPVIDKTKINGILLTSYLSYDGDNIRKVMDSGETIWDSGNSGDIMRLCRVYTMNNKHVLAYIFFVSNGRIESKYYVKDGYKWINVNVYEFSKHMCKLEIQRSLDINDRPDPSIYDTEDHNFFGLPAKVIIPKNKISLVTITDDAELIWNILDDFQECTSVIIHGHPKHPKLLHINIKNGIVPDEMYFVKDGNQWIATIKAYFYQKLNELDEIEEKRKSQLSRQNSEDV